MKAIDFQLKDQAGNLVKLTDFKGKNVILYFYPKDDTSGCTKEACAFRDAHNQIQNLNTVVIGVSGDNKQSHINFINKFNLPFVLLTDPKRKVARQYNKIFSPKEGFFKDLRKKLKADSLLGMNRNTFLIDTNGNVVKSWIKVKVDGHIDDVLNEIEKLNHHKQEQSNEKKVK